MVSKILIFNDMVWIPGIEPGRLTALVFELLDHTNIYSTY